MGIYVAVLFPGAGLENIVLSALHDSNKILNGGVR
jgi:hypothetical protein